MFEFIISSSVLIIVIAVIRCLFRRKVDNRIIYAMWLLLVIKLVLPFPAYLLNRMDIRIVQIKTPLSIMNMVNNWMLNETSEKITTESHIANNTQRASGGIQVDNNLHQNQKSGLKNSNATSKKGIVQVPFQYFIYMTWILGSALIFVIQIVSSCRLRKTLLLNREEKNLLRQKVYVVKKLRTPLLVRGKGFQTDIYIPDSITDNRQLVFHAILHEKIHKKHGDIWWGYVRNILVAIYWFHPLVWMAAYLSKRDAEYACDSGVMEKMDYDARIAYGESLLKLVEMNDNYLPFYTVATVGTGRSEMKWRIVMIKKGTKKSVIAILAVILLLAGTGAVCFTKAESPKEEVIDVENKFDILPEAEEDIEYVREYAYPTNIYTYNTEEEIVYEDSDCVIISKGYSTNSKEEHDILIEKLMRLDEEDAKIIVCEEWDRVGFQYDVSKIIISNIREFEKGFLFTMRYTGEGACNSLYYVMTKNHRWKILETVNGSIAGSAGLSISEKNIGEKLIVWGNVGDGIYDPSKDVREEVSFQELGLVTVENKKKAVAIQNNSDYLLVIYSKGIADWRVKDDKDNVLFDLKEYKKSFGTDLLE